VGNPLPAEVADEVTVCGRGGENAMRTPNRAEGKLVRGAYALSFVRSFRRCHHLKTEGGKAELWNNAAMATVFQRSLVHFWRSWGLSLPKKQCERFAGANLFLPPGFDALDRHDNPARRRATKFRQTQAAASRDMRDRLAPTNGLWLADKIACQ